VVAKIHSGGNCYVLQQYTKSNQKFGLILSLVLGFIVLTNTTAQAQYRTRNYERNDRNYGTSYRYDSLNLARQYGYKDGFKDGADAAREGDRYHPQNSGDWQKGTNGYEDRYGSKNAYKSAYRQAYLQGYKEGFNRAGNRGYNRRSY
jgi:hypothetical protein